MGCIFICVVIFIWWRGTHSHTHTGLPNNNNNMYEYYYHNKNNTENSWKSMKSGEKNNNNKLILVEKLLRLFVVICSTPVSLNAIVLCWICIEYTKQMSNVNFICTYVFVVRVCSFHYILSYMLILHMDCIQSIGPTIQHQAPEPHRYVVCMHSMISYDF